MLSVVIGSAAIVVSISKNDNTNRIVFGLTIAIVTIISLLLIRQLYHEDGEDREESQWKWHGHFGVVTYIFILIILCLYFVDPALA
jgi:chromate transport protein ChrA